MFDKETMPQTQQREQAAQLINQRPGCRAYLTQKRGIEDYFHVAAIMEALGVKVDCEDGIAMLANGILGNLDGPMRMNANESEGSTSFRYAGRVD